MLIRVGAAQQAIKTALMVLFLVGMTSAIWTMAWLLALPMFVFGDAEDPGDIARAPHWLMFPAPLSLLGFLPSVREMFRRMGICD